MGVQIHEAPIPRASQPAEAMKNQLALFAGVFALLAGPFTVSAEENGKITAPGHHEAGAEAAEKILKRLDMPADRLERIVWVIQNHIFHIFWNLSAPEAASKRHKRLVADPRFPLLLELLRVDTIASWGKKGVTDPYILYKALWEMVRE